MKISYTWLKEYVRTEASPLELRRALTMVGLAAEASTAVDGDVVIEMDITSNRPDCLNHVGIAREVATIYHLPLQPPELNVPEAEEGPEVPYAVDIENVKGCARYSALLMTDVQVGPSPEWMQKRLTAIGLRPVNNIVDITNYVLFEFGHPLHAFDYQKLTGGRIIVRAARAGETLVTLDGVARTLDPSMLVIADAETPVALAGIIGGLDSAISPSTRTILLESAFFNPQSIRRTARQVALSTDASYRFERKADIEATVKALQRTAHLMREIAGGKVCGKLIDVYPKPVRPKTIVLRQKRAEQLIGVAIDPTFVEDTLTRLGFRVKRSSRTRWKVIPPTFRVDVGIEVDLIEEVARHYGYDKIPATTPASVTLGQFTPSFEKEQSAAAVLKSLGYSEAINWSFISEAEDAAFRAAATMRSGDRRPAIKIGNPISEVDSILRATTLPSLLKVVRHNFNYDTKNVRVFEFGRAYVLEDGRSGEYEVLGMALTGEVVPAYWGVKPEEVNFFHLKGAVETVLNRWRVMGYDIRPAEDIPFFHPYVAARIERQGTPLGILGRLHPNLEEEYKLKQGVYLAELDMRRINALEPAPIFYEPIPKFPAVWHDVSFLVTDTTSYHEVEQAIRGAGIPALRGIFLSDLYRGERLPAGKKSLSVRLTYQNPERTLTTEEATDFTRQIRALLVERFEAELR